MLTVHMADIRKPIINLIVFLILSKENSSALFRNPGL
jgi:hypothetical protein